jgi:hypothetical protein
VGDYVFFDWSRTPLPPTERDFAPIFLSSAERAAQSTAPPLEVRHPQKLEFWGSDIAASIRETISGAIGAFLLLSYESVGLGVEVGMLSQSGVPLLVLESRDESLSNLVRSAPTFSRFVMFDPLGTGYRSYDDVEREMAAWMKQLRRRHSEPSLTTISIDELRSCEILIAAFYRHLTKARLDWAGQTFKLHRSTSRRSTCSFARPSQVEAFSRQLSPNSAPS